MFALLAYSFITLFAALVVLGHGLLVRDMFFAGGNSRKPVRRFNRRGMRQYTMA